MREVAVISFAQVALRRATDQNEVELLMPVVREALERSRVPKGEIDFTVSGSSDYLQGQPFAFVLALDAVGAWPPICESHVEMDGAWALYEAWVKLQTGEADTALVYSFGKSSPGDLPEILALQLDPYCVAPLWPDSVSLAALQARTFLETTPHTERDLALVAVRSRHDARENPNALVAGKFQVEKLLGEPYVAPPLRKHDCAPITDGAAAVVLAAGDRARALCDRPAWIRGIDHRVEPQGLGLRDLTCSSSTKLAAEKAGLHAGALDSVELHAPFTHQELILRGAMGLAADVAISPSGGALVSNPMMGAGLVRIGESAQRILDGNARRTAAHATSGPCLQQNLVCVLEAD